MSSDGPGHAAGHDGTRTGRTVRTRCRRLAGFVADHETELWALAVATLVGDLALTTYGLQQGLSEANPVASAAAADHGVVGLAALKGFALAVGLGGWLVLPERAQAVVPLALSLPWTLAVVVNLATLAVAA